MDREDRVILIHGLVASKYLFLPLGRSLRKQQFGTKAWSYWSVRGDIHRLSDSLARYLEQQEADASVKRLHVVAHSMGSIITRAMLATNQFNKLHRIVMLAPPHRGSRVATTMAPWLGSILPPLHQLSDSPSSAVNQLQDPTNIEIGVIAASRDRVVAVQNTHLSTEADHTVVNYGHTSMLFRREVSQLVIRFLDRGKFA